MIYYLGFIAAWVVASCAFVGLLLWLEDRTNH